MLNESAQLRRNRSHLIQARRQAGLLGARVNEGVVQAADDLVGHSLERPRPHADVLRANVQLDHVVHAVRALRDSRRVHCLRVVLQLAERLLLGQKRIDDETESGRLTLRLLVAPALTFVERQVLYTVVGGAGEVEVGELLERNLSLNGDHRY